MFLEKHGFDAIESVSSNVMPNLKNIVGRISCTAKEFVDINEISAQADTADVDVEYVVFAV